MSRFARQLSAAQRQYDNDYDREREAEEARQEAVDTLADQLLTQYARDPERVLDAVESVNTLGFDGFLDRAVRDFLMDYNAADNTPAAVAEVARALFDRLWPQVKNLLSDDARMDAKYDVDDSGDAA